MVGIDPSRYDGVPKLSEETAVSMIVGKNVVIMFQKFFLVWK